MQTNKPYCESSIPSQNCRVELADILRRHINDYQIKYKLHPDHYKVVANILECRTAFLGGHIHQCSDCGSEKNVYNSCRNRHCPKCQTMVKARWLEARKAELLPVQYFHNVFTLPHEVNPVALCNKRVIYSILFRAASETLLAFGKNPDNGLGGKLGIISLLHTWDQKLNDHIHLHCVIPAGVLSFDNQFFKKGSKDFLFPVKALSKVFRGKFMEMLQTAYDEKKLIFPGRTKSFGTASGFRALSKALWSKEWVVYSKKPFSGPETVLEYLSRYTHRVAISNNRIKTCKDGKVTFTYRNRKKETTETLSIETVEFIRRFLMHVVPPNFMRIRHFGIFANRCKKKNISQCRKFLGLSEVRQKPVEKSVEALMFELTGININRCPFCKKGVMKEVSPIPKLTGKGSHDYIQRPDRRDSS